MASKLDILVNLLRKGIRPDPSLIGRYGLPQYTDSSSGNVLGRSTEQPTYQQQAIRQPVNTAIINAVTSYGADIIENPVQTLAIDPAVAAVKSPAKTLQAFGDLTSAKFQRATGRPYQQKLESGLTSLAEAAGGAAEVVGVGVPLAKAVSKPLKGSLSNLFSKNSNTLQPKPVNIYDEIAEEVGTADEVAPVVDERFDPEIQATKVVDEVNEVKQDAIPLLNAPKKTQKAYKLFKRKKGQEGLYPLFVNADKGVEQNQWIKAEVGEITDKGKVKSKLGPLAYRPGWHAGDYASATHIGGKSTKGLTKPDYRPADQVWAEVEVADDFNWQDVANGRASIVQSGANKGKINVKEAHITDQIPEGGHYRYKTNPNMQGNWIISGEMKVNKPLTKDEVFKVGQDTGIEDLPILPDVIEQKGLKIEDLNAQAVKELKDYYPEKYKEMTGQPSAPQELMPTSVVDDAVDATQELMPPSRIADEATTTPLANETKESMQKTYAYLQKQSGMKPKEFKEFLENARTDPKSAEMLFNINNQFIVTARGFGQMPETSAVIANAVKQQNINQGKRISKSFDIALGNPDTAFQTVKKINTAIEKEAKPIYEQAFEQGINMTQGLQDVMSIPLLAKYEKIALKRLIETKKTDEGKRLITNKLRVLHEVKRKLDGDIGRSIVSNDKTVAKDLLVLKKELLKEIDLASPTYKKARKVFSDEMENLEALEYGSKNIFKSDVGPEEFAEEIAEYSKAELESLRVGIKKAIRKVEAGKPETYNAIDRKFILPNTRAKLEVAIGKDATNNLYDSLDAEQVMFKQSSSVDPGDGSITGLNLESSAKARTGLQNPVKISVAKTGEAVVKANANPMTLLGRGVSGVVKKATDSVTASYNEQLAKAAADVLTRPANEGIDILLAAAPKEKVGIARQIIAKTEGQPSNQVTLQANNVVDAADIINAPQKQGIDTLESVAPQKKVGIAREIISQTQGKPVTPLKRKAIEVLSAQALNPEMQNIARGLGGAGAVSATSSDEPNVLSNMLAAPNAEGPKTATNIQELPAGAVIYPNNYNQLKSGDIYYKEVNGAYVGYRKK